MYESLFYVNYVLFMYSMPTNENFEYAKKIFIGFHAERRKKTWVYAEDHRAKVHGIHPGDFGILCLHFFDCLTPLNSACVYPLFESSKCRSIVTQLATILHIYLPSFRLIEHSLFVYSFFVHKGRYPVALYEK